MEATKTDHTDGELIRCHPGNLLSANRIKELGLRNSGVAAWLTALISILRTMSLYDKARVVAAEQSAAFLVWQQQRLKRRQARGPLAESPPNYPDTS